MKLFMGSFIFRFVLASLVALPVWQLFTTGYLSWFGWFFLLVSLSAMVAIVSLLRHAKDALAEFAKRAEAYAAKSKRIDDKIKAKEKLDIEDISEIVSRHRRFYNHSRRDAPIKAIDEAKGESAVSGVMLFLGLLFTSAIWFDFISPASFFNSSKTVVYDEASETLFHPDRFMIYIWSQPENYRVSDDEQFSGSTTDHRAYQHHATGQIIGYNTQTWESQFDFFYSVPDALRLEYFKSGNIPDHDGLMQVVFRDSVDAMYYRGLGTFETTSDLQNAVREEVLKRCAVAFKAEACPVNVRINIPFFPRRGPVRSGPGDMQS